MAMSIPAAVPATHRWIYYAINYGYLQNQCAYSVGPAPNATQMKDNEAEFSRGFYWCDTLGGAAGGSPFNPTCRDWNNTLTTQDDPITTARWQDEVLGPLAGDTSHVNRPTLVQPNILGTRSSDPTWPGGAALQAWTPGGPNSAANRTQYVQDCVDRWADLMLTVPYAIPYRLWHEHGNATSSYGDTQMRANGWAIFRSSFRKVVDYLRTRGVCVDDATGKPNFMTTKAFITWCPAGHAANPGSDVESFPHTNTTSQKDGTKWVHIIGRDPYTKAGQTVEGSAQLWVDEFHPDIGNGAGHGPSNPANRPLMAAEMGNEPADPQGLAKCQEQFDRLTGNHAKPWKYISSLLWWNASSTDLNTAAGQPLETVVKNNLNTAFFIPNGIATEPTGTTPTVTIPVVTSAAATAITSTSATIPGTVDPNNGSTNYRVEYGPTVAYGTQTQLLNAGAGDVPVPVSVVLPSLTPGTVYHYRITASNSAGSATPTADRTFTTDAVTVNKPIVALALTPVDGITQTAAVVHGTVNPNGLATTYHVEYGTTVAYGTNTANVNAGAGTSAVTANVPLSGLTAGQSYHARITATNSDGTSVSSDAPFQSASPPPPGTPGMISMGFLG